MYLEPESENGNIEYKITLHHVKTDSSKVQELASQMRYRLYEGNGEAYYYIGVADDGTPTGISEFELNDSLERLKEVANIANAKVRVLRKTKGQDGLIAECFVQKLKNPSEIPMDIRIAVVGNVDAGKSTIIGVLENGELDDGRGAARARVVRYLHELESGRTSSIKMTMLGFDENGQIINHDKVLAPSDFEILERAVKTITFVDLAGHEKYLKTTIKGLTGNAPNYAVLVVSANQGVLQMTKEHLGLLIALKIPFFVLISKLDITPEPRMKRTIEELKKILKMPGVSKVPLMVRDLDDVVISAKNFSKKTLVPFFPVSTVRGDGLENVYKFLQLLPVNHLPKTKKDELRVYIDDIFTVKGAGTVVSGMIYSGSAKVNQLVALGPFKNGEFENVRIKSIHYKRVNASEVFSGQMATFALANVKRDNVRKGMVLLSTSSVGSVREFTAEIFVLYHSTTIKKGYTPVVHCRSISQSAKIIDFNADQLRTGDRAEVDFEFVYRPEYIRVGQRIIFREGRTKGIGIITKVKEII